MADKILMSFEDFMHQDERPCLMCGEVYPVTSANKKNILCPPCITKQNGWAEATLKNR